jgi:electron transport complex protein RnfC
LANPDKEIHTIVVLGGNSDILITGNQYIINHEIDSIIQGIRYIKDITGLDNIIIAVPRELAQGFGHTGATLKAFDSVYPCANPKMFMKNVLHQTVPAGMSCEDLGVCFFSAEAVASIGKAFKSKAIPTKKLLTLVKKDGSKTLVTANIGTLVKDIFKDHDITITAKDRLIIGGPLTGSAIFSENHPVQADTDAIMLQDTEDVTYTSDYPCINCGECIRICPARLPINMLVRFLEAGLYNEAAEEYDLLSCIECGLCSVVCVSKIPIFQYIKLAKYELSRIDSAEANS